LVVGGCGGDVGGGYGGVVLEVMLSCGDGTVGCCLEVLRHCGDGEVTMSCGARFWRCGAPTTVAYGGDGEKMWLWSGVWCRVRGGGVSAELVNWCSG
jgi:hypothetical protein